MLDDRFDFIFNMEGHGWSSCLIMVDKGIYQVNSSHVRLNPIESLLNGCLVLLNWGKTGEVIWSINRIESEPSGLQVRIQGGTWLLSNTKGRASQVLEFNVCLKRFILCILHQMRKLRDLLTYPAYKAGGRDDFPHLSFEKFELAAKSWRKI
jgi:hypothetical protein